MDQQASGTQLVKLVEHLSQLTNVQLRFVNIMLASLRMA